MYIENKINEDSIIVLCKILLELSDLKYLILEDNEISLEDLNTLFDALKCYSNLKYVNIRGIDLDYKRLILLKELVKTICIDEILFDCIFFIIIDEFDEENEEIVRCINHNILQK